MEPAPDGPVELERHLEQQMRAQERQLAAVRLGMAAVGALLLAFVIPDLPGRLALLVVVGAIAAWSLLVPWLLGRFPAREVGIVSTVIDMAAVTIAVYVAADAIDIYLFYGLVILATALRFGLGASLWSSLVMSGMYAAVVVVGGTLGDARLELLPLRIGYLIGFGVVAGLFSRIVIGRATDNARLRQRVAEEEQQREQIRERELLSRLGRDFGASLDRQATLDAVVGAVCATAVARQATEIATGDPDGMRELGIEWLLAVPILAGGRLLGVLATAGRRDRPLNERIGRLAEAVAERAGPAIQNAQLWSDLQDRMSRERAAQRIKDDFLSIVSHELRTPLTSIQGYSQLLEGRLRGSSGETKEMAHLRVIRSQVGRMRRLVDDLLDVSRIDRRGGVSIEPIDFDLAEELRDAVSRIAREHTDRRIDVAVPASLPVHADRDRIDQVLTNLIENAVKYSPDGGPIAVSAEGRGGEVEVRVADTGVGIPAEHRENVFERFYQADDDAGRRRFGGLGLGLYISRAIVDAHGGRIWVAANGDAPSGSVFGFRIPRVAMPLAPAEIAPTGEPPAFVLRRRDG
jgi:signal transduction histidine kinase